MIFDDDEPSPATLKAWRQPMSACWKGSILAPSDRRPIFRFKGEIERGDAWHEWVLGLLCNRIFVELGIALRFWR
jgi:hypothetical protein